MNKDKEVEEYISLRSEINQLCTAADTLINMFYVFIVAYLAFVFETEDTIYILFSYAVFIPSYLLVIARRVGTCRISAYIAVFHENEGNRWENRLINFKPSKEPKIFKSIDALHLPFVFLNLFILILYMIRINWSDLLSGYEIIKLIILITQLSQCKSLNNA